MNNNLLVLITKDYILSTCYSTDEVGKAVDNVHNIEDKDFNLHEDEQLNKICAGNKKIAT